MKKVCKKRKRTSLNILSPFNDIAYTEKCLKYTTHRSLVTETGKQIISNVLSHDIIATITMKEVNKGSSYNYYSTAAYYYYNPNIEIRSDFLLESDFSLPSFSVTGLVKILHPLNLDQFCYYRYTTDDTKLWQYITKPNNNKLMLLETWLMINLFRNQKIPQIIQLLHSYLPEYVYKTEINYFRPYYSSRVNGKPIKSETKLEFTANDSLFGICVDNIRTEINYI